MTYRYFEMTVEQVYKRLEEIEILIKESKFEEILQDEFFSTSVASFLIESVEQIKKSSPTKDGEEDVFEILLKNGQKFYVHLNFINPSNSQLEIISKQLGSAKQGNTVSENYKKYFKDLKNNEQICYIMFNDSFSDTKITNTTNIYAVELFAGINQAIFRSFYENGKAKNLRGILIRISNDELKRLSLYKRILRMHHKEAFPNVFADEISEAQKNTSLLIATK